MTIRKKNREYEIFNKYLLQTCRKDMLKKFVNIICFYNIISSSQKNKGITNIPKC